MDGILKLTTPLYKVIYSNDFFFFDLWSLVHFSSGWLIMMWLCYFNYKWKFFILIMLLILYEIAELIIREIGVNIFIQEERIDQITDIWVGLLGGLIWYLIWKNFIK